MPPQYPLFCLGERNVVKDPPFASAVAQLRAFNLFSADFKQRYPDGETLSELEYIDDGIYFVKGEKAPSYRSVKGKPRLTDVYRAMSQDYRNGWKSGDFRKSDGLGLDASGIRGELLEVTTWSNRLSAIGQMEQKLRILNGMNLVHELYTLLWRGTPWKPQGLQRFQILKDTPEYLDYICFEPTFRNLAGGAPPPEGVILYEVHRLAKPRPKTMPVTVVIPENVKKTIIEKASAQKKTGMAPEKWAEAFLAEHHWIGVFLRGAALVGGIAMVVVAIAAIFDPVPGDEVAAFSLAMGLMKAALR